MKILQLVSGHAINGAIMHCLLLSKQLEQRGHDVTVMCLEESWMWRQLENTSLNRVACNMKRRPGNLAFGRKLIREGKFDVIHSHLSRAHFFGVIQRRLTGTPCVATAQCCRFQFHWRWNDFVIANSTHTENYHRRVNGVAPDQIKRIHLFIDWDKFQNVGEDERFSQRRALGVENDEFLLGVVGDVIPRKGQHVLVEALPELVKLHPKLKVAIVGEYIDQKRKNFSKRLQTSIARQGLTDRVIWTGVSDEIPQQMAALDICLVPSLAEPLGMVAMESLATRTPVIASDVGGLPEIVKDGDTGLLVQPNSAPALVEAVNTMLKDPELMRRTAQRGHAFVLEHFSPDVLTRQIEQVYEDVCRKRAAAA